MPKQGTWNKSFWRKLNNVKKIDEKEILSIIHFNTMDTYETIRNLIPVRYGGLKTSVYGEVYRTANGISGRVGIDNDPHVNLKPGNVHSDDFTNRELAEMLLNKQNKSQSRMADIKGWLEDYRDTTTSDLKNYWDSKIKRR